MEGSNSTTQRTTDDAKLALAEKIRTAIQDLLDKHDQHNLLPHLMIRTILSCLPDLSGASSAELSSPPAEPAGTASREGSTAVNPSSPQSYPSQPCDRRAYAIELFQQMDEHRWLGLGTIAFPPESVMAAVGYGDNTAWKAPAHVLTVTDAELARVPMNEVGRIVRSKIVEAERHFLNFEMERGVVGPAHSNRR